MMISFRQSKQLQKILMFKKPDNQVTNKLSEEELWSGIDHPIDQADRREVLTPEETISSIDREFAL